MVRSIKNLIAAILIALSGFIFWTQLMPKYDDTSRLKESIEARTIVLETRNRVLERIAGFQKEFQDRYTEIQRLGLVVPGKKSLPELVSTLEDISSKTGVILGEVSIGSGAINATEPFNLINVDTSLKTSYDSLLSLLAHLEKNIRLIDTTSLTIGLKRNDVSGAPPLEVQVKTEAYYLKSLTEAEKLSGGTSAKSEE